MQQCSSSGSSKNTLRENAGPHSKFSDIYEYIFQKRAEAKMQSFRNQKQTEKKQGQRLFLFEQYSMVVRVDTAYTLAKISKRIEKKYNDITNLIKILKCYLSQYLI